MRKYDVIHNNLQAKLFRGEITLEAAEKVERLAYESYGDDIYVESGDDVVDMLKAITKAVEDEKLTLDKDQKKVLKEIFDSIENDKEDEDEKDEDDDDESEDESDESEDEDK